MTRARRHVPMLSDEEEARLQEQIAKDPDNPELTEEELAQMRPASEVLPPALYAALTRPRGRPKAAETKQEVKLRLDRKAVEAFKRSGPGWQTRMNDVLVRAAKSLDRAAPAARPAGTESGKGTAKGADASKNRLKRSSMPR